MQIPLDVHVFQRTRNNVVRIAVAVRNVCFNRATYFERWAGWRISFLPRSSLDAPEMMHCNRDAQSESTTCESNVSLAASPNHLPRAQK